MNWDLAILMKQALDEINKLGGIYDAEATKTLALWADHEKYLKNTEHGIYKIEVIATPTKSQFSKWRKKVSPEGLEDGFSYLNFENSLGSAASIILHSEKHKNVEHDNEMVAAAHFSIAYPVFNGKIEKTLGEVHIEKPGVLNDVQGMGVGTLLYMVILYICYQYYGAKYFSSHAIRGASNSYSSVTTSYSAERVYKSLANTGVLSPVRDDVYHKKYLSANIAAGRAENLRDEHGSRIRSEVKSENHKDPETLLKMVESISEYQELSERTNKDFHEEINENYKVTPPPLPHKDLYEINHLALINFFKEFAKTHPNLQDDNGRLNIEFNHRKDRLI